MKKYFKYLLSFITPCLIFPMISAILRFFPFGENSLRIYDAKNQYPGFFLALKNFSFYSLGAGLGFNLFATATYYLFSPLNFIFSFLNQVNLDVIYTIVIYLKIGLSGLFMTIFLDHKIKDQKLWPALFGIIYALSGFISCYYYNIMWLDGIYMLPLVMLGLERIIHKKSPSLYMISLVITILSNYYIGYMICIFSVLYFFFLFFTNPVKEKKVVLQQFFVTSILAGMICAIVILPSYFGLMGGKAYGFQDSYTKYLGIHDSVKSAFYHLSVASFQTDTHIDGFALIYFSIFCLILVAISFFSKTYPLRYKILVGVMLLFYFLSFSVNFLDYAWEMFQRPVWWPSRYAFTFSAFCITIAYDAFVHREELQVSYIARLILIILIPILFISSFAMIFSDLHNRTMFSLLLLAFSILLTGFYLFAYDHKKFSWLCVIMVLLELSLNLFNNMGMNKLTSYVLQTDVFHKEVSKAVSEIKEMDPGNYRMEFVNKNFYQDGLVYGFHGINYFNSVRNQRIVRFAEEVIGLKVDSHCSMVLNKFDPLLLSLLHVKYLIGSDFQYWHLANKHSGLSAYQNPYPLSYGFIINDEKEIDFQKNDFVANLEKIAKSLGAKEDIYLPSSTFSFHEAMQNATLENRVYRTKDAKEEGHVIYTFEPESSYFLIPDDFNEFKKMVTITVNGEQISLNSLYPFFKKGDKVEMDFHFKDRLFASDLAFHLFSVDRYESLMQSLTLLELDDTSQHILEGDIDVTKDHQLLFLSLPYEDGFIIQVDGKKVSYETVWDTFIGIHLEEGNHHITVDYIPKGFVSGACISLTSLMVSIVYLSLTKKKCAIINAEGNVL